MTHTPSEGDIGAADWLQEQMRNWRPPRPDTEMPRVTVRTAEFLARLDDGMLDYFREMADVLVERFGISRAEAVARINARYADIEIEPSGQELMTHELPEYWAFGVYFLPHADASRLPYGDEDLDGDLSKWEVRPAPPREWPVWTLEEGA
ncbi:hypothetical protein [Streptomyces sporangiiformans]|nr:hypothetical protein [Streptomyces sporangiiformans]